MLIINGIDFDEFFDRVIVDVLVCLTRVETNEGNHW